MYPSLIKFLTQSPENESDEIMGMSWNNTKNLIVTYGHSGLAEIWAIENRLSDSRMEAPLPHLTEENAKNGFIDVVSASWNKYGILATGGGDGIERIWDEKGELLQCLRGHEGGLIYSSKWSTNSDYLLTMGSDHLAIVWDATTSRIFHKHSFKHSNISVMEGDWKNNLEFATCAGNEILLWNQERNDSMGCFKHQDDISTIKWDPSGTLLFSICEGGIANIWTPSQEKCIYNFDKAHICNWYIQSSNLQFAYCIDKMIKFINLTDGRGHKMLNIGRNEQPTFMSFSQDYQIMALGYNDKLELWSMKTNQLMHAFLHCAYVGSLEWSSNGQYLAVCNNKKGFIIDIKRPKEENDAIQF